MHIWYKPDSEQNNGHSGLMRSWESIGFLSLHIIDNSGFSYQHQSDH